MKYNIRYIKKQKQYDFTITFKSLEHKLTKLAQYKEDAINFKATKLLDTETTFKFLPYDEKLKGIKDNKHKTYINNQS